MKRLILALILLCAALALPTQADFIQCIGPGLCEGTDIADVINGTSDLNDIYGFEGDDSIFAGDNPAGELPKTIDNHEPNHVNTNFMAFNFVSEESLWGGPGNDFLSGGPGPDVLFGEEGDDVNPCRACGVNFCGECGYAEKHLCFDCGDEVDESQQDEADETLEESSDFAE